ncbi:MAG: fibrobacter succinogenes major paralogous domain-containing protein [Prolixibacteraceae bacterium]
MKKRQRSLDYVSLLAGITLLVISSCNKTTSTSPFQYGSVSDFEGNAYNTIQIGSQTWMAENLRSVKLSDGSSIAKVTDQTTWSNLTTPAYCFYDNDSVSAKYNFGALYNWYVVDTKKLCPTGWHVPNIDDWIALSTLLGVDSLAGGTLKEAGTSKWATPNLYGTNEYGFNAIPSGYRFYNGSFQNVGYSGNYWSATEYTPSKAWYLYLTYSNGKLSKNSYDKTYGFSVRCIKN